MKLLNWQRNELFQELLNARLHPSDFTEKVDGDGLYRISLKANNDIRFSIRLTTNKEEGNYFLSKMPGGVSAPNRYQSSVSVNWNDAGYDSCVYHLRKWAEDVKREVDSSDLWLESTKALHFFASADAPVADRFTIAELGAVQGQLNILVKSFGTSELPEAAKQRLAEIAQTAMLKAETLTKKDWQYWIQGAFSSTVTSLELTEAQIQEVVALIRLAFGGLFLHA